MTLRKTRLVRDRSPLVDISRWLCSRVAELSFSLPITHVYNPLSYARQPHEAYLRRFGSTPKSTLLVGMNPGPFGMAQTGVPFGDVSFVRDWMGITGAVARPIPEHPKRPVSGFLCTRSEVSGTRLWGFARDAFGTPEQFFSKIFVTNYCPLVFMEATGKNRTPDKLPSSERQPLYEVCDEALRRTATILRPSRVVGVGGFAERRAREALSGLSIEVACLLHPSPANPRANRGWAAEAHRTLSALGALP